MKKPVLLVLVISLAAVFLDTNCKRQVAGVITEEQAKAFTADALKIWNEGDLATVDNWFAPDFILHDPMYPEPIVGVKAFKDVLASESKTFSDGNLRFDDVLIKGDRIVTIWTWSATHSGPMVLPSGEVPPTGNKLKYSGVSISRLVNGKVAEHWFYYNPLDVFLPLGFTLNPPQPPKPEVKK